VRIVVWSGVGWNPDEWYTDFLQRGPAVTQEGDAVLAEGLTVGRQQGADALREARMIPRPGVREIVKAAFAKGGVGIDATAFAAFVT
jgi:hypothetical protein